MSTERMLSTIRRMIQKAAAMDDKATVSRMICALLNAEHDRRVELEKELVDLKLRIRYGRRKGDK